MTDFRPNRFQILPPVVKNIIIINVLMVLLQFVLGKTGIDLADWLGLHYWKSHYFHWWQIVTHIFMHGSYNDVNMTILHIASNMFALWMFGSVLENVWGPKRFLLFYMVCGIGAAICHLLVLGIEYNAIEQAFHTYQLSPTFDHFSLFLKERVPLDRTNQLCIDLYNTGIRWSAHPESMQQSNESISAIFRYLHGVHTPLISAPGIYDEATVGASGAVFGVLFAFGYLFPNTLLYFYFLVPIKAKWVVAAYALFELYSGIRNSAGDNIAHFAHLGGMLFAFILLKIWNRNIRNRFY